jgi:hypothetical protein
METFYLLKDMGEKARKIGVAGCIDCNDVILVFRVGRAVGGVSIGQS